MSEKEKNVVLQYTDADGNVVNGHPRTKAGNVLGLREAVEDMIGDIGGDDDLIQFVPSGTGIFENAIMPYHNKKETVVDLNNYKNAGYYIFDSVQTATNFPPVGNWIGSSNASFLIVYKTAGASSSHQVLMRAGSAETWERRSTASWNRVGTFNSGVFMGNDAGTSTTGSCNTAIGSFALRKNTTGHNNVAIGYNALLSNTTGSTNAAIGAAALLNNTTGDGNVAIGAYALANSATGGSNAVIGAATLMSNTTGSGNAAIGTNALSSNTTGDDNAAIGASAGRFAGNSSAGNIRSDNSIFIGALSRAGEPNGTNEIVIGSNAIGGGSNTITFGDASITQLRCQATTITALSDSRVKEDINPANLDMCYDAVKNLPVTRYKYKDFTGTHLDTHVTGFMADDVEKVFPKSVTYSDRHFPELDENGEQIYEEREIEEPSVGEDGEQVLTKVIKSMPKYATMEDVKEITMTEAVPTMWGAMQKMMAKIEELEAIANELRK